MTGNSLSPVFLPGDFVLIALSYALPGRLKKGDTVVFTHPGLGLLIKSVADIDPANQQLKVEGFHPASTSSEVLGPVPLAAVLGKVIWHIKRLRHPGNISP